MLPSFHEFRWSMFEKYNTQKHNRKNQHTRELISVRNTSAAQVQLQQQRPESPTVTLTWRACKYKIHKLHQRYLLKQEEQHFNIKERKSLRHWMPQNIVPRGHLYHLWQKQKRLSGCTRYKKLVKRLRSSHSSGAVWESRWTSWAVRPNEPSGFRGRKDLLNRDSALVTTCP